MKKKLKGKISKVFESTSFDRNTGKKENKKPTNFLILNETVSYYMYKDAIC